MMNTITHKCENILDELNRLYPDGIILGDSYAIVGDFGLKINWCNADGTIGQNYLEPDTKIPITEIKNGMFYLGSFTPRAIIHHSYFKGFSRIVR